MPLYSDEDDDEESGVPGNAIEENYFKHSGVYEYVQQNEHFWLLRSNQPGQAWQAQEAIHANERMTGKGILRHAVLYGSANVCAMVGSLFSLTPYTDDTINQFAQEDSQLLCSGENLGLLLTFPCLTDSPVALYSRAMLRAAAENPRLHESLKQYALDYSTQRKRLPRELGESIHELRDTAQLIVDYATESPELFYELCPSLKPDEKTLAEAAVVRAAQDQQEQQGERIPYLLRRQQREEKKDL